MKVITAPEYYIPTNEEIAVFLAGGITNCDDWQQEVIDYLQSLPEYKTDRLVIFNPRRNKWPKNGDTEEIRRQIHWEVDYIHRSNIFSMYFTNTKKSDQPICFYELAKYINKVYKIISYQEGFNRAFDVDIQVEEIYNLGVNKNISPMEHAKLIFDKYQYLINKENY